MNFDRYNEHLDRLVQDIMSDFNDEEFTEDMFIFYRSQIMGIIDSVGTIKMFINRIAQMTEDED